MPRFHDLKAEYEKSQAKYRNSAAGKAYQKRIDKEMAERKARYENPDTPPFKDMIWSKKRKCWVYPDKRSPAKKRRDQKAVDRMDEVRKIWAPVAERIAPGWGQQVACGLGWKKLIFDLVRDIDRVWQGFLSHAGRDCWAANQIKEKFGGLRFYVQSTVEMLKKDPAWLKDEFEWRCRLMRLLIDDAEGESYRICDVCAERGRRRSVDGWLTVVCDKDYQSWLTNAWKERKRHNPKLKLTSLMDDEEKVKRGLKPRTEYDFKGAKRRKDKA